MELRKLKKINIGGNEFSIKWNSRETGARVSYSNKIIEIGTMLGTIATLEALIHELKEIIQIEQANRYERLGTRNQYYFFYDHAAHADLCARLAELLNRFIV
jgi:hypothetical protein